MWEITVGARAALRFHLNSISFYAYVERNKSLQNGPLTPHFES